MFEVDFKILNQKATPAIYADTLALRPAAGFAGRLFVATDSPYGVFRDTGTAWVQVAAGIGGSGSTGVNGLNGTTNIGLGGTLANNTTILGNDKSFSLLSTDAIILNAANATNNGISSVVFNSVNNSFTFQNFTGTQITEFIQNKTEIKTKFNTGSYGLSLDNSTGKFVLGDYNNDRKYNSFVVDDDNDRFYITTSYNQSNTNQDLFYVSNNPGANERFVKLGDFNSYQNETVFIVNDNQSRIETSFGGVVKGLNLIFGNQTYEFGDSASKIICDVTNAKTTIIADDLNFDGAIIDTLTYTPAGYNLIIKVNGTPFKIPLYN